jgi:hypothetical protein
MFFYGYLTGSTTVQNISATFATVIYLSGKHLKKQAGFQRPFGGNFDRFNKNPNGT